MKQEAQWCGEYQQSPQAVVDDRPTVVVPVYTPENLPETPKKRRGRPSKDDQTST
jgi:hypothetical protein